MFERQSGGKSDTSRLRFAGSQLVLIRNVPDYDIHACSPARRLIRNTLPGAGTRRESSLAGIARSNATTIRLLTSAAETRIR
jgi:hypothetical protein